MADVEKVIEDLINYRDREFIKEGTSYFDADPRYRKLIINEAIELLKEKEPVECELEGGGTNWWYVCGDCHGAIDNRDSYCKHCGRKVKQG